MSTQTLSPQCLHCVDHAPEMLQHCTQTPDYSTPEAHQQWYQQTVKYLYDAKQTLEAWELLDATHQRGYLDADCDRAHNLDCLKLLAELR